MNRNAIMGIGAAGMVLVSVCGTVHAVRTAISYAGYYQIKYGGEQTALWQKLDKAEDVYDLYPWNYNLCIWCAEKAYYNRFEDGREQEELIDSAEKWCERGLDLNKFKSQLRLLKARLLARESSAEAAEYWREYVQWDFWRPYHHAVLAEFYIGAGKLWEAADELRWLQNSEYYDDISEKIREAWRKEMQLAPE